MRPSKRQALGLTVPAGRDLGHIQTLDAWPRVIHPPLKSGLQECQSSEVPLSAQVHSAPQVDHLDVLSYELSVQSEEITEF